MFAMSALEMAMRAGEDARYTVVQLNAFGLDNFALAERRLRRLEPWEVRIRVRAASVNFRDLLVARGQLANRLRRIRLPLVPLSDCAGEVVEVGSEVERLEVGDRVSPAVIPGWIAGRFDNGAGTNLGVTVDGVLGEYFTGDQRGFVRTPEELSFEEAATLPCAALTAWNALFEQGNVKPGQTVLVQGAGGVSVFALQFAVAAGARVIATTGSQAKTEKLRRLGATHVVDCTREAEWSRSVLELTGGCGVDHVIETGGADTLDQSIKATAVGGTISLIGMLTGATARFDALPILAKTLHIQGIVIGSVEMFERMNGTIESLGIRPLIDRTFEMQDVAKALEYLQTGRHVGKVVIRIGTDMPD
jgi:NADPH:quinone reductase-like Zn-dependent oxidoreductase